MDPHPFLVHKVARELRADGVPSCWDRPWRFVKPLRIPTQDVAPTVVCSCTSADAHVHRRLLPLARRRVLRPLVFMMRELELWLDGARRFFYFARCPRCLAVFWSEDASSPELCPEDAHA